MQCHPYPVELGWRMSFATTSLYGEIPEVEHFKLIPYQRVRRYSQVGTLLLGRFAIDQSQQGKGMGRKLLLHIMSHVVRLSTETGFQLLLVDPSDHMASEFYRRFGFVALPGESRMYTQLANLRATLENLG